MKNLVLETWFGTLDADGLADEAHRSQWFSKSPEFDEKLRGLFLPLYGEITSGQQESWLETPKGLVAYVIVLDQFSRNLFRDTSMMYDADLLAQKVSKQSIARETDAFLGTDETTFLYMPLMHSEELDTQELGVSCFKRLSERCPTAAQQRCQEVVHYAELHRDIIAQFGRFPHRNALLSRKSTPEEIEFLSQPHSSF